MRMKSLRLTAGLAAGMLLLGGCAADMGTVPYDPSVLLDQPARETELTAGESIFDHMTDVVSLAAKSDNGSLSYATNSVPRLTNEQQRLILDYMDSYYLSLAKLDAQDLSGFFSKAASAKAAEAQATIDAIVGLRSAQNADLTLRDSYAMSITGVTINEDGYTRVRILENYHQKFRGYSQTAEGFNLSHTFLLTDTTNGWKLREHRQMDSLRRLVLGSSDGSDDPAASAKSFVSAAKRAVKARDTQGAARNPKYDNAYNRKAAASYANNWVGARKPGWPNYNTSGGNCMNFVSQALYNGGIPMDTTSPGIWKYYGSIPDNSIQQAGRSASWSSVSSFRSYARTNTGYGLVSVVDAPYYSGEVGDVILMSTGGDFRHVVIITKVIEDDDGKVVDYLISSNTADVKNFPASAYHYAEQTLVKILGWNNE